MERYGVRIGWGTGWLEKRGTEKMELLHCSCLFPSGETFAVGSKSCVYTCTVLRLGKRDKFEGQSGLNVLNRYPIRPEGLVFLALEKLPV